MPSIIRGTNDYTLARPRFPRVSALVSPNSSSFDPLTLSPVLWLKADAANNTLSTTGYAGSGTVTQVGTAITGISTAFLSEVVVGDVLSGTLISGTVTVITDDTHLTVNASNSGAGASYTITPQAGVNDRVTTLTDQSGNSHSPTIATANLKPAKIPNVQNGLPAIRFDGGNDILSSTFTLNQPCTIFLASHLLSSVNGAVTLAGIGSNFYGLMNYTAATTFRIFAGTSLAYGSAVNRSPHVFEAVFNGASSVVTYDGNTDTTGDANTNVLGGITLGKNTAGTPFAENVDIFEVLVCASVLNSTDRANLRSYMRSRWNI